MTIPRTWQATLLLVGTIVGVGMFGIPFVFLKSGFLTGALLLLLAALAVTIVHLAYADVVVRTRELHRLPGYVRLYLGAPAGWLARASYLIGLSGSLLAYVLLGGLFLGELLLPLWPGLPRGIGPLVFYLTGAAIIFRGIRFESFANAIFSGALLIAVAVLAGTLMPEVSVDVLTGFSVAGLLPLYGVVIFAVAGEAIIPDMRRVLRPLDRSLKRLIIIGTAIPVALYLLFALVVVGATGQATTPDAISGLAHTFGPGYGIAGSMIGFLATMTSFITLGLVLKGAFTSDFGWKPVPAWLVTAAIPGVLYLGGFHDFIAIIGLVGALSIGLDNLLILIVQWRASATMAPAPDYSFSLHVIPRLLLIAAFVAGIFYALIAVFG